MGLRKTIGRVLTALAGGKRDTSGMAQIEVTSACGLRPPCRHCPRRHYGAEWQTRNMPDEVFVRTLDGIDGLNQQGVEIGRVHLSLWGDPFRNPRIFDMIRRAKDRGHAVSLTTDGAALSAETNEQIVRSSLDVIGVSIDGPTPEVHGRMRSSDFDAVTGGLRDLRDLKSHRGAETPTIVVSFLMTKDTVPHLPEMVDLTRQLGGRGLAATNLTCTCTAEDADAAAFAMTEAPDPRIRRLVKDATDRTGRDLYLRLYPLWLQPDSGCGERPLTGFVAAATGDIHPCTQLALPVSRRRRVCRDLEGEVAECEIEFAGFGNLRHATLPEIWRSEPYAAFRERFGRAQQILREKFKWTLGDSFDPVELEEVPAATRLRRAAPPSLCRCCPKLYGF